MDFCFYYQSYVDIYKPCGNHFTKKPECTQENFEKIAFGNLEKLSEKEFQKRLEIERKVEKWLKKMGSIV